LLLMMVLLLRLRRLLLRLVAQAHELGERRHGVFTGSTSGTGSALRRRRC
jgi:hypothetical protein